MTFVPATDARPLRILHVLAGMERGGVETWLMNVVRRIDRERYQMDFLVHTTRRCAYDDELEELGCRLIPCLHPSRPLQYARRLRAVLTDRGPFDIVHSHVHHYSGCVLRTAAAAGIACRIAHSHTDTRLKQRQVGLVKSGYYRLMQHLIGRHATHRLACSGGAAAALYGALWPRQPRCEVLPYGIDLQPFRQRADRAAVRAELRAAPDALLIGQVANLRPVKNHRLSLLALSALVRSFPQARLVLAGEGPLRPELESLVEQLGLGEHVRFLGARDDIPRIMQALDLLILPSTREGCPLTVVEAQAAGCPVLCSDVVPHDTEVVPGLLQRLSPQVPPTVWADAMAGLATAPAAPAAARALELVEASDFNLDRCVSRLVALYESVLQTQVPTPSP